MPGSYRDRPGSPSQPRDRTIIMALRRDMPIRDEKPGDDEHATVYQGSRGWWEDAPEKPVPGTPKK